LGAWLARENGLELDAVFGCWGIQQAPKGMARRTRLG
jgi:hypothetical protein